jgi:hypothetical protein
MVAANLRDANLRDVKLIKYDGSNPAILPDGIKWTIQEDMTRFTNPEHPEYLSTLEKINEIRKKLGCNPIPH